MRILRGTKLALVGVVGAAVAWWYGVGAALRQYEAVETALELPVLAGLVTEHAAVLDWSAGAFVGIVAANLFSYLEARGGDRSVRLGATLGVGKGAAAVVAGVVGLAFEDAIFAEFVRHVPEVAEFVRLYLGGTAGFCFGLGVWVGAVAGEVAGL